MRTGFFWQKSFFGPEGCGKVRNARGRIRKPNSEFRKKSEDRNPNEWDHGRSLGKVFLLVEIGGEGRDKVGDKVGGGRDYDYDYDYEWEIHPPLGKRTVSPVTLTLFIGLLTKRTVSGSVSGSVFGVTASVTWRGGRLRDYGPRTRNPTTARQGRKGSIGRALRRWEE